MSGQIPSDNRHSNDLGSLWGCFGFGLFLLVVVIVLASLGLFFSPSHTAARKVAELGKLAARPKEFEPAYQAAKEAVRQFPELQRELEQKKKGYAQALLRATVEGGLPAEPREAASQLKTLERILEDLDPRHDYRESAEWKEAEKHQNDRVRQLQQQVEQLVREKKVADLVTLRGKIAEERKEWPSNQRLEADWEALLLQIDIVPLTPHFDRARELSRKGKHPEAITLLKKLEHELPKNPHPDLKKLFLEVCSAVLKDRLELLRQEARILEKAKKPAELEKLLGTVVSVWDGGKVTFWDGGQWVTRPGIIILGQDLEHPLFNGLIKECAAAIVKLETEEIQELLRQKELAKAYDRSKQAQGERTIFNILMPDQTAKLKMTEEIQELLRRWKELVKGYAFDRSVQAEGERTIFNLESRLQYQRLQGQAVALRLEAARKDFVALAARDDHAAIAALLRDLETKWLSRPAPEEKAQNEFAAFRNSCRFWLKVAENAGKVKLP
jgi:hypothetical protein